MARDCSSSQNEECQRLNDMEIEPAIISWKILDHQRWCQTYNFVACEQQMHLSDDRKCVCCSNTFVADQRCVLFSIILKDLLSG